MTNASSRRYAGEERPVTINFQEIRHRADIEIMFGNEWCKGRITKVDDVDRSVFVYVSEARQEWMFPNQGMDAARLRIPEESTRPNGTVTARLRRQVTETSAALEAVTKERDDARDQLARVCAQVESQAAVITRIQKERDDAHDAYETAALGERSADMEVERLRAMLDKRSKDARILDCVATLLAMRGEP